MHQQQMHNSSSTDWKSRANGMMQTGTERVKSNPGMAAAIVGGVAAAAAAVVYRDKIGSAIGTMRSGKPSVTDQDSPILSGGTLDQGGNMPAHSSMGGSGGPGALR